MSSTLKCVISFALGAAAGVAATFTYAKKKYEKRTQKELDSLRETYRTITKVHDKHNDAREERLNKKEEELNGQMNIYDLPFKDLEIDTYIEATKKYRDQNLATPAEQLDIDYRKEAKPIVISEEEYIEFSADHPDYDTISLLYFSDCVVAEEESYNMIGGSRYALGKEALETVDEDNTVYIRNDKLKVLYELNYDERTYAEVMKDRPYLEQQFDEAEEAIQQGLYDEEVENE